MKLLIAVCFATVLCGCSPTFVGDAPPVERTSKTPDYFELPARFAFVRTVYGGLKPAGAKEMEMWTGLASRFKNIGSFYPLARGNTQHWRANQKTLIETARDQRYNYLLLVRMHPSTGAAEIVLLHVGSGGVMATASAFSDKGGKNGFWGGRINNSKRLQRVTLKIAQASIPVVEEMLRGVSDRQR